MFGVDILLSCNYPFEAGEVLYYFYYQADIVRLNWELNLIDFIVLLCHHKYHLLSQRSTGHEVAAGQREKKALDWKMEEHPWGNE